MSTIGPLSSRRGVLLRGLCLSLPLAAFGGCGDEKPVPASPPIVAGDRERLAAALPREVTLESPVEPDVLYGKDSKTVEDALKALFATVRDGKLVDGGMGREIRFERPEDRAGASKKSRPKKGQRSDALVVRLASGRAGQ